MISLPNNQNMQPSPYIKEITVQNFMQEVVQASLQTPILVYFTAPWCGPCKQFGPLLEKVVNEAKGRVKLAKVDIDKNPELAQQFRVQSVPMIYIFFQGQPMDAFAGVVPESQLKQLIEQFSGASPEAEMIQATLETAAKLLSEGNAEEAEQAYKTLLAEDENSIEAIAGLARCFILAGHTNKAEQLLSQVPEDKQSAESIIAAKAALTLAKSAPKAAEIEALQKKLVKAPLDMQARYDLASALFASGKQEEAIAELLVIIAKDKDWNESVARKQLLTFFEALGHTHPLTMQGRRKLSSILFV
jgi:putative thioredoxin